MDAGLRVLRLCSVFEPPTSALGAALADPVGGMQDHTGSLTRALARRGVVQVVLTARPPTAPWVERIAPNATVIRVGLPVRRPRRLYSVPAALLAPWLGARADLVHVHLGEDLAILPLAAMAAAPRSLPVVLTVHCSLAHTLRVHDVRTALLHTLGGGLERAAARRVAATIVLTRRLAEAVTHDSAAGSTHLVTRGADRRLFARPPGPDPFPALAARPRVVFIGRLVRQKGVHVLVEAASRLRSAGVGVVIVGDGPERPALERRIAHLGLAGSVHVTGFVAHDHVPDVLATAELLVLPSFYEELGVVIIEAMHAGVPVVASRVGGIPEVVRDGETGLLVPPGDADALARAIDTILGDRDLAARMSAAGRRAAGGYDLDRMIDGVEAVYESVTAGRRGDAARAARASRGRARA